MEIENMNVQITRTFEKFPGYVYFVKNVDTSLVKIGWTGRDPYTRAEEIARSSGSEILVIGAMYGSRRDEGAIHRLLRASRANSEWFNQTDDVIECLTDIFARKPVIANPEPI